MRQRRRRSWFDLAARGSRYRSTTARLPDSPRQAISLPHVRQAPHSQSRRNRPAHRPDREPARGADRGRRLRGRSGRTGHPTCRRGGGDRAGAGGGELPAGRQDHRRGQGHGGAGDPSWLWVPGGECRLRRGRAQSRARLRRSVAGGHAAHGRQGGGQGDRGGGGRAGGAGLCRRAPGRQDAGQGGQTHRLSRAHQGGGRRRRARHAARRAGGGPSRGVGERAARGRGELRRRPCPAGEADRQPASHRGAGVRRPARQRSASLRARLLAAAAQPEGDRGGAGAGHAGRAARAHLRGGCRLCQGGRTTGAPARWNFWSRAAP